jgi:hypothetical protein
MQIRDLLGTVYESEREETPGVRENRGGIFKRGNCGM